MSETYVKTLVEELSRVISADSVIGEPIVQEDKVLFPVIRVGFGIGSGSGRAKGGDGAGEGGGGGGGLIATRSARENSVASPVALSTSLMEPRSAQITRPTSFSLFFITGRLYNSSMESLDSRAGSNEI